MNKITDFIHSFGVKHYFSLYLQTADQQDVMIMDTESNIITKKHYAKPIMLAERFVANEFVASCSVLGTPLEIGGHYLYDSGTNSGWVDNGDVKIRYSLDGDLTDLINSGNYEILYTENMSNNGAQGYILIDNSISLYGINGSYDFDYYNLKNTQYWMPGIIAHVKITKSEYDVREKDLFFQNPSGGSIEINGS